MLEQYGFYSIVAGLVLVGIAFLIVLERAFRTSLGWGFGVLVFPPAAFAFTAKYGRTNRLPIVLFALAALLIGVPFGLSYYERHFVPLEPYEQIVDGELRITLTGLSDFDYAKIRNKPDVVVLQMANPDVTDATLDQLATLAKLRTLDVSHSQVTDAGLAKIAALPALAELRLGHTKITDAGFQQHLAGKESLRKLDLTATEVKGKTKRDWKKLKPDEREYVD